MGFLDKLFSSGKMELGAPVQGETVPISEVPDPTFGEEILGKGIAIRPTDGHICAPCDGIISLMFDMGHAVSMVSDSGVEILIHVGLDTVKLKGTHYTVHCLNGDKVKAGQLLIECDLDGLRADGYDTITPVVICNSGDLQEVRANTGMTVSVGDTILTLRK